MLFSFQDLIDLQNHGLTPQDALQQIEYYDRGFKFAELVRCAKLGDGIIPPDEISQSQWVARFEAFDGKVTKFVPASGAATRMFRDLFSYISSKEKEGGAPMSEKESDNVSTFFDQITRFAFGESLKSAGYPDIRSGLDREENRVALLRALLEEPGLGFGNLPKGLIPFHKEDGRVRTPLEEHILEALPYCAGKSGSIHFTLAPAHLQMTQEYLDSLLERLTREGEGDLDCDLSVQDSNTDVIAADLENLPLRSSSGSIVLRPAGHGALLDNLSRMEADIVFVENIDNVAQGKDNRKKRSDFKKMLGGGLLNVRDEIFSLLRDLDAKPDENSRKRARDFIEKWFGPAPPALGEVREISDFLNRPLRIAAMVPSKENTGGGPFWTRDKEGRVSLQIVETAQIDMSNPQQLAIIRDGDYANPVNLALSLKDYKGNKFDLTDFRDMDAGFITEKSQKDLVLRAMELPGLWNGGMAGWLTLFIEAPVDSFSPAKSVLDLLKPAHQQKPLSRKKNIAMA